MIRMISISYPYFPWYCSVYRESLYSIPGAGRIPHLLLDTRGRLEQRCHRTLRMWICHSCASRNPQALVFYTFPLPRE